MCSGCGNCNVNGDCLSVILSYRVCVCVYIQFCCFFSMPASFLSSRCVAFCQICCSTEKKETLTFACMVVFNHVTKPMNLYAELAFYLSLLLSIASICITRSHVTFYWALSLCAQTHTNGKWQMVNDVLCN